MSEISSNSSDLALISVIVRSMDRPTLREALQSIAAQTYSHIEVVVVAAKGPRHRSLPASCGLFPLRLIPSATPLNRAQAANAGLAAATGDFLLLLDDDDLLLPNHLEKLAKPLIQGLAQAAYSGVALIDQQKHRIRILDEPWEPQRLRGANFLPIHAVLFERLALERGARFDERLECLEDWDFWLQVAVHANFLHVPGVSAHYRFDLGSSGLSRTPNSSKHLNNRALVFKKWRTRFSARDWVESFFWFESAHLRYQTLAEERDQELGLVRQQLGEINTAFSELNRHTSEQLAELHAQLTTREQVIAEGRIQLTMREEDLTQKAQILQNRDAQIAHLELIVADMRNTIHALVNSTSWRVTRLLRFFSRLLRGDFVAAFDGIRRTLHGWGRKFYWRLPPRYRAPFLEFAYRWASPLLSGRGHYELWRRRTLGQNLATTATDSNVTQLVDLANITPLLTAPTGRIAIHLHLFYGDLAAEIAGYLKTMPFPYDLWVSVPNTAVQIICEQKFAQLPNLEQCRIVIVPNCGRDLAPLFCAFAETMQQYAFICHIHSKKSLYNQNATAGWREYLMGQLLGSGPHIQKIFTLLSGNAGIGLVYPQTFAGVPYMANTWLANYACGRAWCQTLGIRSIPHGYFNFPVGSMFWARTDALKPLLQAGLRLEDFPPEGGQNDGTLAHTLERLLGLVPAIAGLRVAILRDPDQPSWCPWRFDVYLARHREQVIAAIEAHEVRLIVFDIFDTLFTRPLLDAEQLKVLVARRIGKDLGKVYLEHRANAETLARQQAGRDIGLTEIYAELTRQTGLPPAQIAQWQRWEVDLERAAVNPRPDLIDLLRYAVATGKRVVLASDMYLSREQLEAMLAAHGIRGWQALYLSSDLGQRKDDGGLYRLLLERERVRVGEVLVIGDNERADVQVPGDMGMRLCHVLRPVELARGLPRWGLLLENTLQESHLDAQLTLGLIIQRQFHSLFYPAFDHTSLFPGGAAALGFGVIGPLLLGFVQWLTAQALGDGLRSLYFLSREGKLLKAVYDRWHEGNLDVPSAHYLVLSRRAVTVAMLETQEDIYTIARAFYLPTALSVFLYERYGLELTQTDLATFARRGLWPKQSLVEVRNGDITALEPLLAALTPRLLAHAKAERPGLWAYLEQHGLLNPDSCAVVDVGYSGTIQGRLNTFLQRAIHGYYLMTDSRGTQVGIQHDVIMRGCYADGVTPGLESLALLRENFILEKLLSSDDQQILHYQLGTAGTLLPVFRPLSQEEQTSQIVRAEIQRGVLAFVDQARQVRAHLLEDFQVPTTLACMLFETLMMHSSAEETSIFRSLVLDDHYCGRGLVH